MIYFIRPVGQDGPIKIGHTYAKSATRRLQSLQIGNHLELEIFATCEGSLSDEYALHKHLKNHSLRGEWFKSSREVYDVIGYLCSPGADWGVFAERPKKKKPPSDFYRKWSGTPNPRYMSKYALSKRGK